MKTVHVKVKLNVIVDLVDGEDLVDLLDNAYFEVIIDHEYYSSEVLGVKTISYEIMDVL